MKSCAALLITEVPLTFMNIKSRENYSALWVLHPCRNRRATRSITNLTKSLPCISNPSPRFQRNHNPPIMVYRSPSHTLSHTLTPRRAAPPRPPHRGARPPDASGAQKRRDTQWSPSYVRYVDEPHTQRGRANESSACPFHPVLAEQKQRVRRD